MPARALRRACKQVSCLLVLFCTGLLWLAFNQTVGNAQKQGAAPADAIPEEEAGELVGYENIRQLSWNGQDCAGVCISSADQEEIETLTSSFLMLNPNDLTNRKEPRLKSDRVWLIVVYVFLIVYMFTALAIICDEFFVPALEAFVDEFGISMDVAGATFMAAGGSMPELFTSFIATFQDSSEIGFAAIVGSAVFNVLFVIAVCGIASDEVLELSWWPLARDCTFYIIALFTVVLVFGVTSKNEIEWWEALILLFEYICYCSFMKFNGTVVDWLANRRTNKVAPEGSGEDVESSRSRSKDTTATGDLNIHKPSSFRRGIIQILTKNAFLYETAGIAAVTHIQGNLEETFKELDKDGDGYLDAKEVQTLLTSLGCKHDSAAVATALRRITRTTDDRISFQQFQRWYIASEARIEVEVRRVFDSFDHDHNGSINKQEIFEVLKSLGHHPGEDELTVAMTDLLTIPPLKNVKEEDVEEELHNASAGTGGGQLSDEASFEQFEAWYMKSLFYQAKQREHEQEENEVDGSLSLDPPKDGSWSTLFWYVWTYPLCALLYITLPDVRKPKWQRNVRIAVLEFGLSLIWIGLFSNLLYECTIVVCNTIGIPPPVAAVTVLAAGTSIPDLLSSYIVAKHGEGDMAVSSSIGSNIFDVTVGLPLPWLAYNIFRGRPVRVESDSLGFSVLLLIGMLLAVIATIVVMKWRMTKGLGYIMMGLYILFLIQNLLDQLPAPDGVFSANF